MTPPETLLRQRVAEVVAAEFADEGFVVANDKLPRAAGHEGEARCACYPNGTREHQKNANVLVLSCTLQLYLAYEAKIDEHQTVDPTIIEGYAGRLRTALAANDSGSTDDLWYLNVAEITYPDDPTGNKSRFEANIAAAARNPASPA